MRIKRYVAEDMGEAMAKIKRDMGNDAVILNTKTIKKGGFLGLFSKKMIEITAASNLNKGLKSREDMTNIPGRQTNNPDVDDLKQEISDLKKMISDLPTMPGPIDHSKTFSLNTDALNSVYRTLIDNEIQKEIASELIQKTIDNLKGSEIRDETLVKNIVKKEISNKIKQLAINEESHFDKRVIAFIGPTGVGKTTSIAKLAARYLLYNNKSVGLITADTYRVAAVEQLKTYAEIMGIPFKVAYTSHEMKENFLAYKDLDIILIDTAGMSSRNRMQLKELKNLLEYIPLTDIYLVLSATTKKNDLIEIIDNYNFIKPNKLMFTKLDETSTYGCILNAIEYTGNSVPYITIGQSVPEDIREADPDKLAGLILGEYKW